MARESVAAKRAIPILKEAGITAKVINMKPYKDPDEFIKALGAEEYEKRIEQAENSFMFEIRLLSEEYDLKIRLERQNLQMRPQKNCYSSQRN